MCALFCYSPTSIEHSYSVETTGSSAAHVLPSVVMNTPVMLTSTAIILTTFNESSPSSAPKNSVKRPDVEERIVVLATLVLARAAFEKYCRHSEK
jgi:hypothetical protein